MTDAPFSLRDLLGNLARYAETSLVRAQQEFPNDSDIIQVEARLRSELDQQDRALRALERAWAAGPRGSGLAVRVARIYEARNRDGEAEKVLKEALVRHPDDKGAHHMLALHYLRQENFDPNIVEQHLRSSFSVADHNFEERFVLAEFFFYRGQMKDAADLFSFIDEKAPGSFRRVASRRESVINSLLGRYSGMIEAMKPKFFFIRSAAFPNSIFAHNSTVDPDVMSDLSISRDINFRIRFNRAGPVALNIKIGRLN